MDENSSNPVPRKGNTGKVLLILFAVFSTGVIISLGICSGTKSMASTAANVGLTMFAISVLGLLGTGLAAIIWAIVRSMR